MTSHQSLASSCSPGPPTWKDMECPFCGHLREREIWTYLPTGTTYGAWKCATCDRYSAEDDDA